MGFGKKLKKALGGNVLSTALSVLPGVGQVIAGREANQASAKAADEQMAFQERMSSTAHQRQIQDMKAAGLNPILSAGGGASSPSGAMPDVMPVEPIVSAAVSGAREYKRFKTEMEEAGARIELNKKLSNSASAEGLLKTEMANKTKAETGLLENRKWMSDRLNELGINVQKLYDTFMNKSGLKSSAKESFIDALNKSDNH